MLDDLPQEIARYLYYADLSRWWLNDPLSPPSVLSLIPRVAAVIRCYVDRAPQGNDAPPGNFYCGDCT